MERFEQAIKDIFDFNRFEPDAELQGLLDEFEMTYPEKGKESGMREPVSFDLLQKEDGSPAVRRAVSAEKQTGLQKNGGKKL